MSITVAQALEQAKRLIELREKADATGRRSIKLIVENANFTAALAALVAKVERLQRVVDQVDYFVEWSNAGGCIYIEDPHGEGGDPAENGECYFYNLMERRVPDLAAELKAREEGKS